MPEVSWFLSKRISVPSFVLYISCSKAPGAIILHKKSEYSHSILGGLKYLKKKKNIFTRVFNRNFYQDRELDSNSTNVLSPDGCGIIGIPAHNLLKIAK